MKAVNILLTLLSLITILITVERFSITTQIILQPNNFLRLHELVQMIFITPLSVIVAILLLKTISHNYESLKNTKGTILAIIFMIGIYFSATGNGVHELASFVFNMYCDVVSKSGICVGAFFNDYYLGNILYFIGILLWNLALVILERKGPNTNYTTKDNIITLSNAFFFGITIFAYAAFDRVLVGLIFTAIAAIIADIFLLTAKTRYANLPFTTYCAIGYTGALLASLFVRFH